MADTGQINPRFPSFNSNTAMSIPFDSPTETHIPKPLHSMRKLNFEDDDSVTTSNTVTNIPVTKPLSHLFIKKDRKIQSDPFLECRPKKPFDFFDLDNDVPSQPAVRKESGNILIKSQSQPIQDKPRLGLISNLSTPSAHKNSLLKIGCKGENMKGKAESIIEDIVETDGETSSKILEEHDEVSEERDMTSLVLDYARRLSLCTNKNTRDPDLNTIPPQTVAGLLSETESSKYIIVDCRYSYEYDGGHIKGALNILSPETLEKIFFTHRELLHNPNYIEDLKKNMHETLAKVDSYTTNTTTTLDNSTNLPMPWIIFHCEFSQKRGPRALRQLRAIDRELNIKNWPNLYFLDIYILDGGYSNFYHQFPEHCNGDYVRMVDKKFKKEFAQAKEIETKLWSKKDLIDIDQDV